MEPVQLEMHNATTDLAKGPLLGSHRKRMLGLLKHLHGAGITLAVCADKKHLDRSINTLKPYVRKLNVAFPDYVPLALRPKKEKPAKKAKARKRQ